MPGIRADESRVPAARRKEILGVPGEQHGCAGIEGCARDYCVTDNSSAHIALTDIANRRPRCVACQARDFGRLEETLLQKPPCTLRRQTNRHPGQDRGRFRQSSGGNHEPFAPGASGFVGLFRAAHEARAMTSATRAQLVTKSEGGAQRCTLSARSSRIALAVCACVRGSSPCGATAISSEPLRTSFTFRGAGFTTIMLSRF